MKKKRRNKKEITKTVVSHYKVSREVYRRMRRHVERDEGLKFKRTPKVHGMRKDKYNYGRSEATITTDRGSDKVKRVSRADVYVSDKTARRDPAFAKVVLMHELRENLVNQNRDTKRGVSHRHVITQMGRDKRFVKRLG